jgi:D-3-phosphoglycerate dehydrogenase
MTSLVAVADSVFPNLDVAREVLSAVGADVRLAAQPTPAAIMDVAAGADALLVTYAKITADMIARMPRCGSSRASASGVDNVDLEAATGAGIVVARCRTTASTRCRSHLALPSAVRKTPLSNRQVYGGQWAMSRRADSSPARNGAGAVGFGRIPQLVAPKAKAFGMRVVAFDPRCRRRGPREGVERVDSRRS